VTARARRGWREPIDTGIYRAHRVSRPSSSDRKIGRRCGCPYSVAAPTGRAQPRWFTLAAARKERAKALATVGTQHATQDGSRLTSRATSNSTPSPTRSWRRIIAGRIAGTPFGSRKALIYQQIKAFLAMGVLGIEPRTSRV
jgi:hypothetical protein